MLGFERKAEIATILERAGKIDVASLSERFEVCKETHTTRPARTRKRWHHQEDAWGCRPGICRIEGPGRIPRLGQGSPTCKRKSSSICRSSRFHDRGRRYRHGQQFDDALPAEVPAQGHQDMHRHEFAETALEAVRVHNPCLQFICLGGELKESNMSFSGAIPQRIARDYYPSKAFMSCASITNSRC